MLNRKAVTAGAIVLAMLANSVSYVGALNEWAYNGENGADLKTEREATDGTMVYLVAGCGNQPEQAFEFIVDDLADYGVTYVNYRPDRGCDMRLIAQQVIDDAQKNHYQKVLVIGCSIGDYVGRVCEDEIGAYTIAINPEPDASLLKPWSLKATRFGVSLAQVATTLCGWASQWRLYSDCGNRFSSTFVVSQFQEIGYRSDAPRVSDHLLGIIVAEADENGKGEDEFLRGREAMKEYFGDVDIYSAKGVGHGNTVKGADAYKAAWDELWAKAKPRFDAG